MPNKPIYKRREWKRIRASVLQRDCYQCQECKRTGDDVVANTVHHTEPGDDSKFYDTQYMISLCNEHHEAMHDRNNGRLTETGKYWLMRSKRGMIRAVFDYDDSPPPQMSINADT